MGVQDWSDKIVHFGDFLVRNKDSLDILVNFRVNNLATMVTRRVRYRYMPDLDNLSSLLLLLFFESALSVNKDVASKLPVLSGLALNCSDHYHRSRNHQEEETNRIERYCNRTTANSQPLKALFAALFPPYRSFFRIPSRRAGRSLGTVNLQIFFLVLSLFLCVSVSFSFFVF